MSLPIDLGKIVLWAAILGLLSGVFYAVYSAGQTELENDFLEDNERARSGADGFDDRVQSCPPGMFDFGTGKCSRP